LCMNTPTTFTHTNTMTFAVACNKTGISKHLNNASPQNSYLWIRSLPNYTTFLRLTASGAQ
jgi:hypothetical protein